jgi:hypothetical protein
LAMFWASFARFHSKPSILLPFEIEATSDASDDGSA